MQLTSTISLLMFSLLAPLASSHPSPSGHLHNAHPEGVERALSDFIANRTFSPTPFLLSDLHVPTGAGANATHHYARSVHTEVAYNHLRRSHHLALSLLSPSLGLFPAGTLTPSFATLLWHAVLLHELGTLPEYDASQTPMSFELAGAIAANDFLRTNVSTVVRYDRDDIVEAVLLHTDMVLPGRATVLAQAMHLGIYLDAVGMPEDQLRGLWHVDTLRAAVAEWPRTGFREWGRTLAAEELSKPGAHFSILERILPGGAQFLNPILDPIAEELGQPI